MRATYVLRSLDLGVQSGTEHFVLLTAVPALGLFVGFYCFASPCRKLLVAAR